MGRIPKQSLRLARPTKTPTKVITDYPRDIRFVIAFDPGCNTGYAIFEVLHHAIAIREYGHFKTYTHVENLIYSVGVQNTAIVYEDFILRSTEFIPVLTSLEVIGVIKYCAGKRKVKVYSQTPSSRKRADAIAPQVLTMLAKKDAEIYKRKENVFLDDHNWHGYDAMRHGIVFFTRCMSAEKLTFQSSAHYLIK